MEPQRLRATIAEAKAGSAGAYEALLDEYARRLYGYFRRSTGSHHDAEDMLGELSLRLVRTLKDYDHRGRFEPWLFRIAANMVRDRIRRSKASPAAMSISAEDRSGEPISDRLAGAGPPADAGLLAEEASGRLAAALEKLDPAVREMILMRHFGEMSFKELAKMFDCPIGTALARVHRGIQALQLIMGNGDEME